MITITPLPQYIYLIYANEIINCNRILCVLMKFQTYYNNKWQNAVVFIYYGPLYFIPFWKYPEYSLIKENGQNSFLKNLQFQTKHRRQEIHRKYKFDWSKSNEIKNHQFVPCSLRYPGLLKRLCSIGFKSTFIIPSDSSILLLHNLQITSNKYVTDRCILKQQANISPGNTLHQLLIPLYVSQHQLPLLLEATRICMWPPKCLQFALLENCVDSTILWLWVIFS